jgi:PAS domain S-box-containing protein
VVTKNQDDAPAAGLGLSIEALLDVSPDAVVAVDDRGRIAYANPATGEMFGWSSAELRGQQVELLIPERLADQHAARRLEFGGRAEARAMGTGIELAGRSRDGREFPVEISLVPVSSPRGTIVFATIVDITSRVSLRRVLSG